ncbi:MAG: hypothetical protein JEZ07_09935 [Phycisphaerae bacterium]|nr:hypothetical protein [Phycisphaerae bacterium]
MFEDIFRIFWVLALLIVVFYLSLRIARLNKKYWLSWYILNAIALFSVNAPRIFVKLSFLKLGSFKPCYAISSGWSPIIITSIALMAMFASIMPKIPEKRVRRLMVVLIVIIQIRYIFLPIVSIIYYHDELVNLKTIFDEDVCMQSTDYTCGPAAAVTALKTFGIDSTESQLALAADTVPLMGTDDRLLANAIEELFGDQGIGCSVDYFDEIGEMKDKCPILMVVKYGFMVDHFVAVLDVDEKYVVVGDPLNGKMSISHDVFKKEWRKIGIVIYRKQ